jgi:methylglutaconyl-CoA hydratase
MSSIVRIHLNRPEKRNALDRDTIVQITQELAQARENADARVVLLTAAGKDFCSGADLSELRRIRDASALENLEDARLLGELYIAIRQHPLPVVSVVRGRALAGGCGLATACDLILAAETAHFGYPEVQIGFVPAMVAAMVRRCVSEKIAFDLLVTGRILDAREACSVGMVSRVYADADLDKEAEALAELLAARSASAVQLTKRLLYDMDGMAFAAAVESGARMNAIARMTPDCRQGIDRFLNKE